jgi:hypothetical protein
MARRSFSISESGWLHIHPQLAEPDTGATVDYNDRLHSP